MFLFPSPPSSPIPISQMRGNNEPPRRRHVKDLHLHPDAYDLELLLEEFKMMEVEYRRFKHDMTLKMREYEQLFVDYEYVLNKILAHKNHVS